MLRSLAAILTGAALSGYSPPSHTESSSWPLTVYLNCSTPGWGGHEYCFASGQGGTEAGYTYTWYGATSMVVMVEDEQETLEQHGRVDCPFDGAWVEVHVTVTDSGNSTASASTWVYCNL